MPLKIKIKKLSVSLHFDKSKYDFLLLTSNLSPIFPVLAACQHPCAGQGGLPSLFERRTCFPSPSGTIYKKGHSLKCP